MGLAARITKKTPTRRSRVGTDCYMAPEVRWAKERRTPYGLSCDWYTIGVLTYEFSAGTVPFAHPEDENPAYREHDFGDKHCEAFVKGLLDQSHASRLGCGSSGINAILEHPCAWQGQSGAVLAVAYRATSSSSGCVRRRGAALRTREERPGGPAPQTPPRGRDLGARP